MHKRKRNIILLALLAVVLLGGVLLLALRDSGGEGEEAAEKSRRVLSAQTEAAYKAVPSDAVLILDFEALSHIIPILSDTSTFGYGLIDPSSALVRFQESLQRAGAGDCHSLFSLHYSAINEVSLLQILDLEGCPGADAVRRYADSARQKNYLERIELS